MEIETLKNDLNNHGKITILPGPLTTLNKIFKVLILGYKWIGK
jgi:hypothetical protein